MSSEQYTVAVIGGSGIYEIDGLTDVKRLRIDTPYGPPSDELVEGILGNTRLLFLPRHSRGHVLGPQEINCRANICALKIAGATHVLSISAVGSLKEDIRPGDMVAVDQFIDLTRRRPSTFFEDGIVGHVMFADPVCHQLSAAVAEAVDRAGGHVHRGGTYVCMEGPQFSTRAESRIYRNWGASVIGMTGMPEAKLAREAELPFALLALATDYDCWHETESDVSVPAVLDVIRTNVAVAKKTVAELTRILPDPFTSRARGAFASSIITDRDRISAAAKARLSWLLPKDT